MHLPKYVIRSSIPRHNAKKFGKNDALGKAKFGIVVSMISKRYDTTEDSTLAH